MSKKQKARRQHPPAQPKAGVETAEAAAPKTESNPEPAATAPSKPSAPLLSRSMWLALTGVLALVVLAIFANSLQNGFVFDDIDLVVTEPRIRNLTNIQNYIAESYRPLRLATYAIDYAIWGVNATGFRLTNIAIHIVNCALAVRLAWRLTESSRVATLAAVLVFAIHPVQVESVAYISGRRDVLFTVFYLAGFLAYIRFREATAPRDRLLWIGATGVSFAFSLMSKEMAAGLPLACVLWDLYRTTAPNADGERPAFPSVVKRMAREGAVLYGLGAAAVLAFVYYTLVIRHATSRVAGTDVEFWGGSLLTNTLTVPLTYAHYAKLAVWPSTLAAQYYGAFDPASGFADPRVIPAILFLVGLGALSLYLILRSRHALIGFGIAWFLVTLMPASQIIPHHEIVADHYLYLPILGLGFVLAGGIRALAEAPGTTTMRRNAVYATAAVLIALFGVRTVVRNMDWRDEPTLWEATYKAVPRSPRAAYNLGLALTNKGDNDRAAKYYQEAITYDPTFVVAYRNLGATYATEGRFEDAKNVYRTALQSDLEASARTWHTIPDVLKASYETEIAILDAQTGQTEKAREALAALCLRYPDLLRTQDAYATVLQMRGETTATVDGYRTRIAETPDDVPLNLTLGNLLWKTGRLDQANELFSHALALNPDSCMANLFVGRYAREVRPGQRSVEDIDALFTKASRVALTPFDGDTVGKYRAGAAQRLSGG